MAVNGPESPSMGPDALHGAWRRRIARGREVTGLEATPGRVRRDRLVTPGEAQERRLGPGGADQLQPDRQALGEAARDGYAREPGDVDGQGARIGEVHGHGSGEPRSERERDRWRGRGDEGIETGLEGD